MVHGISRFLGRCVRHMQLIGDLRSRNIGSDAHLSEMSYFFNLKKKLKKIKCFAF